MRSHAEALTSPLPASRTLAEILTDLAQLKAHIERTDHDLADYWHHHLTLRAFTAQMEADRQHFHSVIDSLRSQIARRWEQALWVAEGQELSPQEPPQAQTRQARIELVRLRRIRPSSEAESTSVAARRPLRQEGPGLN